MQNMHLEELVALIMICNIISRPGTPTSPLSQTTGASVYADPSEMPKYRRWLSIYILYFTMVTVTLSEWCIKAACMVLVIVF